ncbi:MAG: rubrerythrin [Leptospiraceae bacterium]|nr:rubrerythrin [Leptospiraceae bacterium]MCP5511158.1 rubrerythrin [Leptospiraceae bacterium]
MMTVSMKNTTLLDAVASAIEYEKDCFNFFLKSFETAPEGHSMKEFFKQLAEHGDEHIKLIQELYNELSGGVQFPNLKQLSAIHKFHSTAIFKVMKKIERNVRQEHSDDLQKVESALNTMEDARDFYNKMKDRFNNPEVKIFFKKLADYNEDNRILVEAMNTYLTQTDKVDYYWDDEELIKDSAMV